MCSSIVVYFISGLCVVSWSWSLWPRHLKIWLRSAQLVSAAAGIQEVNLYGLPSRTGETETCAMRSAASYRQGLHKQCRPTAYNPTETTEWRLDGIPLFCAIGRTQHQSGYAELWSVPSSVVLDPELSRAVIHWNKSDWKVSWWLDVSRVQR